MMSASKTFLPFGKQDVACTAGGPLTVHAFDDDAVFEQGENPVGRKLPGMLAGAEYDDVRPQCFQCCQVVQRQFVEDCDRRAGRYHAGHGDETVPV